ncbi:hypothetical protein [Pyruvatibacter mobilis]|uniref:hypothetical protein n=1 Tax=Pyruvatibacter mobilis TaxID=1712261 RepID=UPI003BB10806
MSEIGAVIKGCSFPPSQCAEFPSACSLLAAETAESFSASNLPLGVVRRLINLPRLFFSTCSLAVRAVVLAGAMIGALAATTVPAQADDDVAAAALQELLNSGVSVEELADDITSLLIGRDGRVLKWSADRPLEVAVHIIKNRDPKMISDVERAEAAFLPELAIKTIQTISSVTDQEWSVKIVDGNPIWPYKSDVIIIIHHLRKKNRLIVSENYKSFCPKLACVGTRTATAGTSHHLYEDQMRDEWYGNPKFDLERGPIGWVEVANGRGERVLSIASDQTAHVAAHIYASSRREISFSLCFLSHTENPRWLRAEFLECWLRSMGFVGSSQIFPQAVLGARLPERSDYFLNGESRVAAGEYSRKLPNNLHALDILALQVLNSKKIKAGISKKQAINYVRKLLLMIYENRSKKRFDR